MLTHLLLEIIEQISLLSTTTIKLMEELRLLLREFNDYLAEKHAAGRRMDGTEVCDRKEKLFNRKEAAEYLKVDPRTVTRYRVKRQLRFVYNDNNRIRYRKEDLNDCYHWKWGRRPSG